jgi:hypothetical protein
MASRVITHNFDYDSRSSAEGRRPAESRNTLGQKSSKTFLIENNPMRGQLGLILIESLLAYPSLPLDLAVWPRLRERRTSKIAAIGIVLCPAVDDYGRRRL